MDSSLVPLANLDCVYIIADRQRIYCGTLRCKTVE